MQAVEIRICIGADGSVDVIREPARGFDPPIAAGSGWKPEDTPPVNSAAFMQSPGRLSRGDRERLMVRIAKRMIANELERRGMSAAAANAEAERIGAGGFAGILEWIMENLPEILEIFTKIFGGL